MVVVVLLVVVVVAVHLMSCMHIKDTLACKVWITVAVGCQCVQYYCIACTRCKYAWNDHQMKEYNHPAL